MYPKVQRSTIYNSQDMEVTWFSISMNAQRRCNVYIQWSISHKKEWNWVICSDMDESVVYHVQWSKSEKEKQILHIMQMYGI